MPEEVNPMTFSYRYIIPGIKAWLTVRKAACYTKKFACKVYTITYN